MVTGVAHLGMYVPDMHHDRHPLRHSVECRSVVVKTLAILRTLGWLLYRQKPSLRSVRVQLEHARSLQHRCEAIWGGSVRRFERRDDHIVLSLRTIGKNAGAQCDGLVHRCNARRER